MAARRSRVRKALDPENLVAACLGLMLALSATFGALPALAFCVYPLWCWVLESKEPRSGRGLRLWWIAGFACNAMVFYWIVGLLQRFAGFPLVAALPVAALLWLGQGLTFGLVGWLAESARRAGLPLWLTLPAASCVVFAWMPAIFPWRPTAGVVGWLDWVQLAEIGGAPILDLLMATAGCAGYEALKRTNKRALPTTICVLALLLPWVYGALRLPQVAAEREQAPLLQVGVVQPNVPIELKNDRRLAFAHLRRLRGITRQLEYSGADVVVWPESAYPYPIERGSTEDYRDPRGIIDQGVRGPIVAGAITRASRCDRWNSVVAMDQRGIIRGVSDKVQLLHFGETVPLWEYLPPLQDMFPCPGLRAGDAPATLEVESVRYGVLNCYEDVLPAHARTVAQDTPDILINVTNDAWFGDTREPHLHQLVSRLRTIETRRDLIRAVNTGVSSHVASTGATLYETETFVEAGFVAEGRKLRGETFWVRFGDWVSPLVALLFLAGAVRRRLSGLSVGS